MENFLVIMFLAMMFLNVICIFHFALTYPAKTFARQSTFALIMIAANIAGCFVPSSGIWFWYPTIWYLMFTAILAAFVVAYLMKVEFVKAERTDARPNYVEPEKPWPRD